MVPTGPQPEVGWNEAKSKSREVFAWAQCAVWKLEGSSWRLRLLSVSLSPRDLKWERTFCKIFFFHLCPSWIGDCILLSSRHEEILIDKICSPLMCLIPSSLQRANLLNYFARANICSTLSETCELVMNWVTSRINAVLWCCEEGKGEDSSNNQCHLSPGPCSVIFYTRSA